MNRYTFHRHDRTTRDSIIPALREVNQRGGYAPIEFEKVPQIFVALHEGKPVAFAGLACYHGHWCLRVCVVDPAHRGNGLQRKLIRMRLAYLRGRGAKKANVWVRTDNPYSLRNVLRAGFRQVPGPAKDFIGHPHHKYRVML